MNNVRNRQAASLADIEVTPEYERGIASIESNDPLIFVSGGAGTGKSYFIKYLKNKVNKELAILAPTGVAALNVQGQTIRSFFHFPLVPVDFENIHIPVRNGTLYEKLELLIIDEISMVRADLFDAIGMFLSVNRSQPTIPFGGVQIVLIGDLFQLPPIIANDDEARFIYECYENRYFFSAKSLERVPINYIELSKVFRQENIEFINLLNNIREGNNLQFTIAQINRRCYRNQISNKKVTLTCTIQRANATNIRFLSNLQGESVTFEGIISGSFNIQQDKLPAPFHLHLKKDAQVMFTKNDNQKRWVNGTIGRVEKITNDTIYVKVVQDGVHVTHAVTKETWENYSFKYDNTERKIVTKKIGSYTQFPLMLAWAITINKSQGKTIENIEIDLGDGTFSPGQLYVALSRCPTLEGIKIKKPITLNDIKVDPIISRFYERIRQTLS